MKRNFDEINASDSSAGSLNSKRMKSESELNTETISSFNYDINSNSFNFSSPTSMQPPLNSYASFNNNIKSQMFMCSDCKKLFTSKSNLKVHLRVHTRIKPYHCKSCNYSCMHHSSIKEHLAKIHPTVVHSSSNPAYVFNSIAVPDPEQFNSADFNKEAFIAEAKLANEKLVAQINNNPSSSSVTVSPISNLSSLNSTRHINQDDEDDLDIDVGCNEFHSSSSELNEENKNDSLSQSRHDASFKINRTKKDAKFKRTNNNDSINTSNNSQTKNLSFSINSIMNRTSSSSSSSSSSISTSSPILNGSNRANNSTVNVQNYADILKKIYQPTPNTATSANSSNYLANMFFNSNPSINLWPLNINNQNNNINTEYNLFLNLLIQLNNKNITTNQNKQS